MALGQLAVAKDRVTGQLGLLLKSGVELGYTGATPHPPTSESMISPWYHPAGIFVSLFIYLWPHQAMCGILVPQPGIKPGPLHWASLIAQLVKNPPAMQEALVQFLGQEDPLEKG